MPSPSQDGNRKGLMSFTWHTSFPHLFYRRAFLRRLSKDDSFWASPNVASEKTTGVYTERRMKIAINIANPMMKNRTPFQLVASLLSSPSRFLVKVLCGWGG